MESIKDYQESGGPEFINYNIINQEEIEEIKKFLGGVKPREKIFGAPDIDKLDQDGLVLLRDYIEMSQSDSSLEAYVDFEKKVKDYEKQIWPEIEQPKKFHFLKRKNLEIGDSRMNLCGFLINQILSHIQEEKKKAKNKAA